MNKKTVLSIFADGVRYDSLKYMPFTKSLNSRPLETILGYSISCHPSMYTGVYPKKHKIGFHWVKSEKKWGPYSFLSFIPNIFPFTNPYIQAVLSHFYAKYFLKKKASSFMGYGKILNLPIKYWNQVDINEFKYWDEDNYINEDIKSIFELVRRDKLKYHISKMHKPNLGKLDALETVAPENYNWVYYFIGESDHVSHFHLQESKEGQAFLLKLDKFIEKEYNKFKSIYGEEGFDFVFWSDHGHIEIKKRYDLYDEFKNKGFNLNKFFHLLDSTTARFWPKTETQKQQVIDVMDKIPEAHRVTEEMMEQLHLPKDERIYGKMLYFMDGGTTIINTIHGFGLKTKSMHGYHPDAPGNDGVFVSNKEINVDKPTLPDVFVSTINSLGINYNPKAGLDGSNILS